MTIRVMAIADSDSYLKWGAATLGRLAEVDERIQTTIVLARTPVAPTPAQALAATATQTPCLGPRSLVRRLRQDRPDVVLVATTGPVAEYVARTAVSAPGERPALISGLPGMALPATSLGVGRRRWCDAFIVHSHREVDAYRTAFAAYGRSPRMALTRLPFLATSTQPSRPTRHIIFAAQSLVPATRQDRVRLLAGLARAVSTGLDVVIKLRARHGERQTHNEAHPFDVLWEEEHARLGFAPDELRFVDGPMSQWLTADAALVTVSSTAAIESLALGRPTALLDDFGVGDHLLNSAFVGSGCFTSLARLRETLRLGGPTPDPHWCAQNYLHGDPSELPGVVRELAARRSRGDLPLLAPVVPLSTRTYLRTLARIGLPAAVTKRLPTRLA